MHITVNTLNLDVHDSANFLKELENFVVEFSENAPPDAEETEQERFARIRAAVLEPVKGLQWQEALNVLTSAVNEHAVVRGLCAETILRNLASCVEPK